MDTNEKSKKKISSLLGGFKPPISKTVNSEMKDPVEGRRSIDDVVKTQSSNALVHDAKESIMNSDELPSAVESIEAEGKAEPTDQKNISSDNENLHFADYFKPLDQSAFSKSNAIIDASLANLLKIVASQNNCTMQSLIHNILVSWKNSHVKEINKCIKKSLL